MNTPKKQFGFVSHLKIGDFGELIEIWQYCEIQPVNEFISIANQIAVDNRSIINYS